MLREIYKFLEPQYLGLKILWLKSGNAAVSGSFDRHFACLLRRRFAIFYTKLNLNRRWLHAQIHCHTPMEAQGRGGPLLGNNTY
jgi:hypothetical protein